MIIGFYSSSKIFYYTLYIYACIRISIKFEISIKNYFNYLKNYGEIWFKFKFEYF